MLRYHTIVEVRSDGVLLRSGVFLPCGLVVWSAGVAPTDFVSQLPFAKNVIGQVCVQHSANSQYILTIHTMLY